MRGCSEMRGLLSAQPRVPVTGDGDDGAGDAGDARYPTVVKENQPLWRGEADEVARLEASAPLMAI